MKHGDRFVNGERECRGVRAQVNAWKNRKVEIKFQGLYHDIL